MTEYKEIAQSWFNQFADSLTAGDVEGVVSSFLPDGWLRDLLVFTWDNRSLEGHDKIRNYLANTLATSQISDLRLDERADLEPEYGQVTPAHMGISAGFTFTSAIAHGQGFFRLVRDEPSGDWRALTVYMSVVDLKGYEEQGHELGVYGNHTIPWSEVREERVKYVEENVQVLVVGAGQTGLNVAARLKQMNIPTLVVDRTPRVGDVWRLRYPTLTLHTPRTHHNMLYQPFPKNWPIFTARDKLADWMEQYAVSQDLVVWTSSTLLPSPKYDHISKTWTVHIDRAGTLVELHPVHIVIACGTLGSPRIPSVPKMDVFQGAIIHTGSFQGANAFAGKKAVVVGAGNTSADICQDLVHRGAASVTMVQRSSTCVISVNTSKARLDASWPEGVPTEICDFKFSAMPFGLLKKIFIANEAEAWAVEREMHEGLRKAGIKLNMGPDGSGQLALVYERLGGFWVDVGCAKLIADGKVKVKQGVEVAHFTPESIVFTDGSSLEADVVIFATGYHNIRENMRDLFGNEIIDRTGDFWGLDSEGELKGCYRPSGYPGLWFAGGDFHHSRYMSKRMALEMKAMEVGLIPS